MPLRTRLVASGSTLVLLAALTACSSGADEFVAQSADEIAEAARSAMGELDALRLDGTLDSDGTPVDVDLTIATDGVDEEATAVAKRWDIHFIRNVMLVFGVISSVFDYLTFAVLLWLFRADMIALRT